jgi:iron uptake system EfeUOB component EfeO/EfeM
MSIKQTKIQASTLLTGLCLSGALLISSCGNKDKSATTTTTSTSTDPAVTTPATTTTTGASTAPVATAPATGGGAALSATEKAQLTPAKTALVMANSAVKSGDITKAKAQYTKFSSLLPAVEPILKAKAGANYPAIESGLAEVKAAMSSATPDKAKAGEGLTAAIKGMTAVIDKK